MVLSMTFKTHPNAPVVINPRGNRNPMRAKYASVENAYWMLATLRRLNPGKGYQITQRPGQ